MRSLDGNECKSCQKSFSTGFDLIEHNNIHLGKTPFTCSVCDESFSTIEHYVTHAEHHNPKDFEVVSNSEYKLSRHLCKCDDFDDHGCSLQEKDKVTVDSSDVECEKNGVASEPETKHKLVVKIHKCTVCPKRFNKISQLMKHSKVHGNKFKCQHCSKTFINARLLMNHLRSHRHGRDQYTCSQCNMKFQSLSKYQVHKKEAHNFVCIHCNKWYSSQEKLLKHVCFIFSNGEPFKCSCFQTFSKAESFKLHVGNRPYSCCNCSMQFNTITNLIRHIRTHTKQKPYICKDCGRGFSQSANLRNHLSIHLGIRAIKCDKCNFCCKTQSGLFKHKKKHLEGYMRSQTYIDGRKTSTNPTACPICEKQFLFKRNVGMHMKIHKKKECLCTECGKVFDSKSKLTTHFKACHGAPSICQTCGKTFASSVLLSAHEKIHVTDKQFTCSICYKMFSIKNYLVQHMKTHNDGKQYSCSKCGKLFKVASSLKYHNKICSSLSIAL